MYRNVEKITSIRCLLGEGPCWDHRDQTLYWIDILKKNIHSLDLKNGRTKTISLKQHVGSIGLRKESGIVAALQDGFYYIDENSGKEKLIKKINGNSKKIRFNDGKIDANGNFWAGTVSVDEESPIGVLYCLRVDLELIGFFNEIMVSNGIVWSLDNKKMYYIDTPTMKVDVMDFDIESSAIRNRKVAFEVPKNIGYPDGMTIDMEEKLWIAHWKGHKVCRWDPVSNKIMEVINIPAERVSSCTFGGKDLSELFITTARIGFTESLNDNTTDEGSGYVYKIQTKTNGLESFRFGT